MSLQCQREIQEGLFLDLSFECKKQLYSYSHIGLYVTEGITEALDMIDITLRVSSIKYQSQQLNPEEMHVSYAVKL